MTVGGATETTHKVPAIVAEILARRGLTGEQALEFCFPDYDRQLHDPFKITDMEAAVARIEAAAVAHERVAVYGDYDIDGITATVVMLEGLAALGLEAEAYIPDRFEEGYGINQQALEKLQAGGCALVISVDCGITSVTEAAWARSHGLDLVITDHHSVPATIPEAVAVVNPKRSGGDYPFKDLAGVGVAFKLVQALQMKTGKPAKGQEKWLLDLVALGTVCDVVPLVGENRVLASFGLKVLAKTRRPGLAALARVGEIDIRDVTARHLGFVLGPRMNASGRLEHAKRSLDLVRATDAFLAQRYAHELNLLNQTRRTDQDKIYKACDAMAGAYAEDPVLLLASSDWSHGIVGVVASKLMEKWQKPVLIAQILGDTSKGSARSLGSFNVVEALRANGDVLLKFGGHFYAAGFTLETNRLEELRAGLNRYFQESGAIPYVRPPIECDASFDGLGELDWQLLADLAMLEPFGHSNLEPALALRKVTLHSFNRVGAEGKHLKFSVRDTSGATMDGIAFGKGDEAARLRLGQSLTVIGRLHKNEFRGKASLQLVAEELRYE